MTDTSNTKNEIDTSGRIELYDVYREAVKCTPNNKESISFTYDINAEKRKYIFRRFNELGWVM